MKRKRSISNIIALVILIIIVIMVAYVFAKGYDKKRKEKEYAENIKEFQEFSNEYIKQTVMPRNLYELYKYKGDYDRDILYKNMKVFEEYLGYLKNNINSQNAYNYYSQNEDKIKEITGIATSEEFEAFIKEMENHNVYSEKYLYAEVVLGSSYKSSNYFIFDINFYYGESLESDNLEKTTFTVAFSTRKDDESPVCIYGFSKEAD